MPYFVNVCVCRGFMFSCVGVCICLCALHNLCGRTRPGNPFEVRGCACFLKRVVFFLFFLPMCMWFVQVCDQRAHVGVQRGAEVRTMTDMSVFVSPLLLELQAVLLRNISCQTLCQRNPLWQAVRLDSHGKPEDEVYSEIVIFPLLWHRSALLSSRSWKWCEWLILFSKISDFILMDLLHTSVLITMLILVLLETFLNAANNISITQVFPSNSNYSNLNFADNSVFLRVFFQKPEYFLLIQS